MATTVKRGVGPRLGSGRSASILIIAVVSATSLCGSLIAASPAAGAPHVLVAAGSAPVPGSPLLPMPGLPGSGPVPAVLSTPPSPGPAPAVPAVVLPHPVSPVSPVPPAAVAAGPTAVSTFAQSQHNANGSVTLSLSPSPLFRKTASGLATVDATVQASSDPTLPAAANGALRPIRFGANASQVAQLALDAGPVTLSAPGLKIAAPQVSSDGVAYAGVAAATDLRYRVSASGLKEEIVLASAAAPTSFMFHLADPSGALGAATATPGGGYVFANKVDDATVSLPAPFAYEQKAAAADGGHAPRDLSSAHLTLTKAGDGWDLVVSLAQPWLLAGRSFPIVIDPTLTFSEGNSFDGSYAYSPSFHPTCPGCYGVNANDPQNGTGTYNDASFDEQPARSAFSFNLSSIPLGSTVTGANLNLYQDGCLGNGSNYYCNSHSYPVELHAYTGPWDPSTATWDSLAPLTSASSFAGYTQGPFPGGTRQWAPPITMTGQVQSWVNGPANYGMANYGFALMLPPQPANWGGPIYPSAENTTYPQHPYLLVAYNPPPPPGPPTAVTAVAGNSSATLHWTAPVPYNPAPIDTYAVNVYNADGTYAGIQVAACGTCTSAVVSGLTNGRGYYFLVYAHNAGGWSTYAIAGFVTPAVPPGAPTNLQGSVSTGWYHSLVARPDGTVAAFGLNNVGQLGNNTIADSHVPIPVPGLSGVTQVAAGYAHSLALKTDGTVWAWGYNSVGQLGNDTVIDSHVPIPVPGLSGVVAISTSFEHNLALKADGTVWAWGLNNYGQLGIGSVTETHHPTKVDGLANMVSISAGYAHSLASRADGSVWAFGLNNTGQLGNNTVTDSHGPIQAFNIMSAVAVSAGASHSVALRGDGVVMTWGYNGYGQLGNNTTADAHMAIEVPTLTGITAISADGGYDTMARKTDGSLWAFGYNANGQLGNNTTTGAPAPVQIQIPGLAPATQVQAGLYHSLAIQTDGTLAAWGYNGYGQLGNNTVADSHLPIPPNGPAVAAQSATLAATAGTRTVTVTWTAPAATGGAPITSYGIALYQGTPGSGVLTGYQSCAGPCTTATFAGLVDNTTYYLQVAAGTLAGVGPLATSNPTTTAGDLSGAGDRPFFAYHTTAVNDRITANINIGTGNLEIISPDLSVPVVGGTRTLGHVYNSLALAPAAAGQASPVFGNGWRFSDAPDRRLIVNGDRSVTFMSGTGNAATFAATTYVAPAGLDATLTHNGDGTWTMTYHQSAERLTFRADGLLTADADRNGNTVTITYPGGGGYETSITGTAGTSPGNTVNLIYAGPGGRLSSMTQTADSTTRTVTYSYDAANNLCQVTDAAGQVTTFGYDAANNLTQITGPAPINAVHQFGYDAGHRATTITQVIATGNAVTGFDYTTAGHTKVTDPDNHPATDLTIDSMGRVTGSSTPRGNTFVTTATSWTTQDAKVSRVTNALGGLSINTYDPQVPSNGENLTQTQSPTLAVSKNSFQVPGQPYLPDSSQDSLANNTAFSYTGIGNLQAAWDMTTSATSALTFNADGTVATSTEPNNITNPDPTKQDSTKSTRYVFNPLTHQLITVIPPVGNSLVAQSLSYDGFGRLKTATSGKGVITTYGYDNLDRTTAESFSDATPTVSVVYDAQGDMYQRIDASGTTTYGYDNANRLLSKALPGGGPTLSYTYDPASNLLSSADASGTTTYGYNSLNQVDQLTEPATGRIDIFGYDAAGNRTDTWDAATYPGGGNVRYDATGNVVPPTGFALHTLNTFDTASQLTETRTTRASSDGDTNRLADLIYSHTVPNPAPCATETAGMVTTSRQSVNDVLAVKTTTYCYDTMGRLTAATTPGAASYTYGYDASTNRISDNSGTHNVNTANQLTDTGYTYDANGNLTASPAFTSLAYNGSDQTTSITPLGATAVTFGYSGASQAERTTAGATTSRNGAVGIESEVTAGATTTYILDPGGALVAERVPGEDLYYYFDGLGSAIGLVNASGTSRATYTYDPYGAHAIATGINGALPANPWRFAGGYLDAATGLYHLGARYYDPSLGRFLQTDPIQGGSANNYDYVNADPVNSQDLGGTDVPGTDQNPYSGKEPLHIQYGQVERADYARNAYLGHRTYRQPQASSLVPYGKTHPFYRTKCNIALYGTFFGKWFYPSGVAWRQISVGARCGFFPMPQPSRPNIT